MYEMRASTQLTVVTLVRRDTTKTRHTNVCLYMRGMTYVHLVSRLIVGGQREGGDDVGIFTHGACTQQARWSTNRDDGERGGRLRRGVGVNRLRVSRLSNAQGIRVRIRGLVPCRAEAQAEAQHQQCHWTDQQVARPGHRALPWNRWHPSVIDSASILRRHHPREFPDE